MTKKRQRPAQPIKNSAPQRPEPVTDLAAQIDILLDSARAANPDAQIQIASPGENVDLGESWKKAEAARQLFEAQTQRLQEAERKVQQGQEQYQALITGLESQRPLLEAESRRLETWEQEIVAREKTLNATEIELRHRERNAEAGFLTQQRAVLAPLETLANEQRDLILHQAQQLITERTAAFSRLQAELDEMRTMQEQHLSELLQTQQKHWESEQQAIAARYEEIEAEKRALNDRQRQIRREQNQLKVDAQILEEDRHAFDQKVERLAAVRITQLESEKATIEAKLAAAHTECNRLQELLAGREEQDRRFGHLTPEEIFQQLESARRECDALKQQLALSPGAEAMERLQSLDRERQSWEIEGVELRRQVQESKNQLSKQRIGVIEMETLRDQKTALEASNAVLHRQLEELRGDVERRMGESERTPFPACLSMDQDTRLQGSVPLADVPDLARLVEDLRHRMGYDPETGKELYYELSDVRSFLAGLAMSYLTILQGISGTGKTSLPKAFARAVGGHYEVIEVQAGWRDRADLIGHYNSFEGKFYEQKFLQALYRAQCPLYQDRLFFIVLDEMNLSYPEQYFADLISALEGQESEHRLDLMPEPLTGERIPKFIIEGRRIHVPTNVWFIGTANQDETTKDFADKTYDRAHVMELPVKPERFQVNQQPASPPSYAYSQLRAAFASARKNYESQAVRAYEFLEMELGDELKQRFGIGWGNRLQRQVGDYVPVVLAAGGTLGEAVDYILALKILRKARNRYEYKAEDFEALQSILQQKWSSLRDKQYEEASKSLNLIKAEIRQKRS